MLLFKQARNRVTLPAVGRTMEGDQGTGRGGREASERTALAQLRKMRVSPNHSGWGHAGRCTPPPPILPSTLQVHSRGEWAPEPGLQPNSVTSAVNSGTGVQVQL